MSWVVVSAARFEAEAFLGSAWAQAKGVSYLSCGIGALNAAKAEERLATLCAKQHVVFVGTAGAFEPFDGVRLVQAGRIYWLPTCERLGVADTIDGLHPPLDLPRPPSWLDLPKADVVCGPTISRQSHSVAGLIVATNPGKNETRAVVENLELYSCIAGLARSCKSLAVVLAITNEVCSEGRKQWRNYHLEAADLTARYLVERLSGA